MHGLLPTLINNMQVNAMTCDVAKFPGQTEGRQRPVNKAEPSPNPTRVELRGA
jgi:hypothetical protein